MQQSMFGPYRIEELLGRGGMGEVYRAYDTETDRIVALKLLPGHLAEDEEYQARFRRECRVAARLSEPHVVPIHRFGEIDGRLYLDMRLVEGSDLGAWLREHGAMPPDVAVAVVGHVAQALDAAHRDGLVHRDVKPSNVLLSGITDDVDAASVFAYLVDFGIARSRRSTLGPAPVALTQAGVVPGSPSYVAPERFKGVEGDLRADVYALGCVLHQALTAKPPFTGDLVSLMRSHLLAPPPRPSVVRPGVPAELDDVVARGMAKEPQDRYASAGELAAAARAALRTATETAVGGIGSSDEDSTTNIGGPASRSYSGLTRVVSPSTQTVRAPAPAPARTPTQGTGTVRAPTHPPGPTRAPTQGTGTVPPPLRAPAQSSAGGPNWTSPRPPASSVAQFGPARPPAPPARPPAPPVPEPVRPSRSSWAVWIVAAVLAALIGGGGVVFFARDGFNPRTAPRVPPTFEEAALLAELPPGFGSSCLRGDETRRASVNALALVSCTKATNSPVGGPDTGTFTSFASSSQLNAAFKKQADDAAIPPQAPGNVAADCQAPTKIRSVWAPGNNPQAANGQIACFTAADGTSYIIWTDNAALAMGYVGRTDGNAAVLYTWWASADFKRR